MEAEIQESLLVSIEDRNKIVRFYGKERKLYQYRIMFALKQDKYGYVWLLRDFDYKKDAETFIQMVEDAGGGIWRGPDGSVIERFEHHCGDIEY